MVKLLTILIPVFNEAETILLVLNKIKKLDSISSIANIVVIDDGSTDKTNQILLGHIDLFDVLITLEKNKGKGAAIIEGLKNVETEYVLIQDADLEYDPSEIPRLWNLVQNNNMDLLMTSRISGSPLTRVHYFWHRLGNQIITLFFNLLHNTTFTDIYSGFIIFKRSLLGQRSLLFHSWGQQAEILSLLTQKSEKNFETPIPYYGRTYAEGKKIRFSALFNVIFAILITKIRGKF